MAISAAIKPTLLPASDSNNLFLGNLFTSTTRTTIFHRASSSIPRPLTLTVKCSSSGSSEQTSNLRDALAGIVDERVDEMLNREENKVLLDGLEKASQRVELAKRELAGIQKQELEAKQMRDYISQLESRASEIEECQKDILEARAMVEQAESFLSQNEDEISEGDEIDKDEERLESIKAASVSAIVGTLAGLPISFTQVASSSQLILPLGITFVSCALFGVTFRYTIRRDLDNVQLKTGTSAAFGFVKGLAMLGGGQPLELSIESFLSHAFDGAIYVSQSLFVFISASVALDYCFKMGLVSFFPMKRSISRTNSK
ncbi:hypothetical protein FNV43_RR25305 [Rhamnella rubrinervis]|uniref:Homer protein n=1 Tax=Rhamnella rubrinervis TaxID=2594499 RepID=A0A8K0GM25_9ROSA|nr:hypothetical protein FNV43_RR25305 [Rhamnella rubrinervis]